MIFVDALQGLLTTTLGGQGAASNCRRALAEREALEAEVGLLCERLERREAAMATHPAGASRGARSGEGVAAARR